MLTSAAGADLGGDAEPWLKAGKGPEGRPLPEDVVDMQMSKTRVRAQGSSRATLSQTGRRRFLEVIERVWDYTRQRIWEEARGFRFRD